MGLDTRWRQAKILEKHRYHHHQLTLRFLSWVFTNIYKMDLTWQRTPIQTLLPNLLVMFETGDQVSVVQFLQMLLKEGKLSEEQALAYVDAIKRDIEAVEEKEAKEEREKEELERVTAQEQAKEESLLEKAAEEAAESLKKEKEEHELILRINDYLEEGLAEGKISKNIYNHLKEGLIESVVDGMREDVGSLSNSDYAHY